MVLVEAVDQRRVLYVNTHPGMAGRRAEDARLRGLSADRWRASRIRGTASRLRAALLP